MQTISNDARPAERRLTRREASAFLTDRGYPVARKTLDKYAVYGGGPSFQYFGRRPLYAPSGLLAWVAKRSGPERSTTERVAA